MKIHRIKPEGLSQLTKKSILDYIVSMKSTDQTKLPREEILAQELGVSRITVRSALNELASEGVIFRRQGKGTFINREALHMNVLFNPVGDLRKAISDSGYRVQAKVLHIDRRITTALEAEKLQCNSQTEIFVVDRLFYANDVPAVYCTDRIPCDILPGNLTAKDFEESIYVYFSRLGRAITWDKVELSVLTSSQLPVLAEVFCTQDAKAFLNCDIINFDEQDRAVFYANEYVDTDFVRYQLIRQKRF